MEDWGAVKSRLQIEAECTRPCDECGIRPTDIRAALERAEVQDEQLRKAHERIMYLSGKLMEAERGSVS